MDNSEVFICYRGESQDAISVGAQIHTLLEHTRNIRCFYAPYTLHKGEDFKKILPGVFKTIKIVVVLLTKGFFQKCFNEDDIVFYELQEAFKNEKIKFLPIVFSGFNYLNEDLSCFSTQDIDRFKHINAFEYFTPYSFDFNKVLNKICDLKGDYIDTDKVNRSLMKIINRALGESVDVHLSKKTFSSHKDNPSAQESKLVQGDSFEIMTNSLTYDLDTDSIYMISDSISNGVRYYYYLENNSKTKKEIRKFLNGIYFALNDRFSKEEIDTIIQKNLALYWLPQNVYPYSFTLINRPKAYTIDNCSLYFVKKEEQYYLYEVLLNEEQELVDCLRDVFNLFKRNIKKVDLRKIVELLQ